MSVVDALAFIGDYPYRDLGDTSAAGLLKHMDRLGIDTALVAGLPSIFRKDPARSNTTCRNLLEPHAERLLHVPVINPSLPLWEEDVERAVEQGSPAVLGVPLYQGLEGDSPAMRALVEYAGSLNLDVVLPVKLEDGRQRHPIDVVGELPAHTVRHLARIPGARLIVVAASREFVEEVHFGLTPGESERLLWDVGWIWGAPSNDLQTLLATIGPSRFVMATMAPLRIPDAPFAKLELTDVTDEARCLILGGSVVGRTRTRIA